MTAVALIRELEMLATLDRDQMSAAGTDSAARRELAHLCLDEVIELRGEADYARDAGDNDAALYYEQEASAWQATATLLRTHTDAAAMRRSA